MIRVLVLAVAATLLVPGVLAQSDRAEPRGTEGRPETPGEQRSPTADAVRGEGPSRGPSASIGSFHVTGAERRVDGDFVDFTYTPRALQNVTAGGLPLFSAEAANAATTGAPLEVESRGSRIDIRAPAYSLRANDNPNAIFSFVAEGPLRISFPEGATLRSVPDGRVEIDYGDGRSARLFGATLDVDGRTVTAERGATFMLDAKKGAFDVHRSEIAKAAARNHIGAEVTIGKHEGGKMKEDVVEFGNVSVQTITQPGNVTLVIDGHGFDGRVIVVNVDPSLFAASKKEDFVFKFDNATIPSAGDLQDVLDPDDDGLRAEYWFVHDENGVQVILSVPHYSVHTFTIAGLVAEVPPSVLVGLVASAVVVAAGYAVLFRAPRRRE